MVEWDTDGSPVRMIGTHTDITQIKRMQDQLAESNRELDEFAYIASHDLKAPLRAINNLVTWIEEDVSATASEDAMKNLATLKGRVQRMNRLLDDTLSYARIDHQSFDGERISGREMADGVLGAIDRPASYQVEFTPQFLSCQLPANPLEQMLYNLIGNAIKHRDRDNGRVDVRLEETENDYIITVQDDGPGIDPEYHDRVFEMFRTLQSRDRVEGSGMGLAIVRKLVQVAGGAVTLESKTGQGACFTVHWPKNKGWP